MMISNHNVIKRLRSEDWLPSVCFAFFIYTIIYTIIYSIKFGRIVFIYYLCPMNYEKLRKEFTKVLRSLTRRRIKNWIIRDAMASNRKFYEGKKIDWRRTDEEGQYLSPEHN